MLHNYNGTKSSNCNGSNTKDVSNPFCCPFTHFYPPALQKAEGYIVMQSVRTYVRTYVRLSVVSHEISGTI